AGRRRRLLSRLRLPLGPGQPPRRHRGRLLPLAAARLSVGTDRLSLASTSADRRGHISRTYAARRPSFSTSGGPPRPWSGTRFADTFVPAIRLLEECWAHEFAPDPSMQPLHHEYLQAVDAQNQAIDWISHAAAITAPRVVILRTLMNGYHATATALTWALWEF